MDNQETAPAFEPTPLSDILSRRDDAPATEAPAGQPEPEARAPAPTEAGETPEAKAERLRTPDGKFAPKPEGDTGSPPAENAPEPEHVPRSALHGERERRQKAERLAAEKDAQIAELMRKLAAPPAPAPVQQQPTTDPTDAYWQNPVEFTRQETAKAVEQVRFQFSETAARRAYSDYDETVQAFTQAVQQQVAAHGTSALAQALARHEDPAEFAYRTGKQALTLMKFGTDPEAYINAQVEQRLAQRMAEREAAAPRNATPTAPLPGSLAATRSTGGRTPAAWAGPVPLSAIIGPRAKR
jgi:hypothetical protein